MRSNFYIKASKAKAIVFKDEIIYNDPKFSIKTAYEQFNEWCDDYRRADHITILNVQYKSTYIECDKGIVDSIFVLYTEEDF